MFRRIAFAFFLFIYLAAPVQAADKLKVVATTTAFAELARVVGGDWVDVEHLASPKQNVHFVEVKPSHVKKVRLADLFIDSGIDLEAWTDPLLEAVGKPDLWRGGSRNVGLAADVRLLEVPDRLDRSLGDIHAYGNPHFWLDPRNLRPMARTLAARLAAMDPVHAEDYASNERRFGLELDAKISEWKSICARCAGRGIVSYHKDLEYFADFLQIRIAGTIEPKPGIPPTPRHLLELETRMRADGARVIAIQTYFSRDIADTLAAKTGAKVAIVAQNPGELPGTDKLFDYYDRNVSSIARAMDGNS